MASAAYKRYRQRLLAREQELGSDIARIESEREQVAQADSPDVGDRANRDYDKEALLQQLGQARADLTLVSEALRRATEGAYGDCLECGRPVEPKRLEAVPWARYCLACQEKHDSGVL